MVRAFFDSDGQLRELETGKLIVPRIDPRKLNSPAASAPDEDAPYLTKEEIAEMRRVK
jgi:hypothetical protein